MIRARTQSALERLARLDKADLDQKQLELAEARESHRRLCDQLDDLERLAETGAETAGGNVPALFALASWADARRAQINADIGRARQRVGRIEQELLDLRGRIKLVEKLLG
ncbi:MAG: hypothetical protein FJX35_26360 [Alphaproteobacteria bacterium]|nr:hypothetical protein [Alphaproteobacteria bacterium]